MSYAISRWLHPSSDTSSQKCPSGFGYQMWTVKGTTNAVLEIWATTRVRELQLQTMLWQVHNNRSNYPQQTRHSYTWQHHQTGSLNRSSSSQQSHPSQHHHREAAEIYRLERRAYKSMATEHGLYNTTSRLLSTTGITANKWKFETV